MPGRGGQPSGVAAAAPRGLSGCPWPLVVRGDRPRVRTGANGTGRSRTFLAQGGGVERERQGGGDGEGEGEPSLA